MKIGSKNIGVDYSTFIIAELSANHNGSLEVAKETVKAAKTAGADAIKLQTYTPDTITLNVKSDQFKISGDTIWDGRYLYDLYKEAYTPWEWHQELFELAAEEGLVCFSSPFDKAAVDFLEDLNTPAYKIASFEITDIPLISYVASKGKPVIISTGIAGKDDIELALKTCHNAGNYDVALLKCTSAYPANPREANLITIPDLALEYNVISGLSDHTLGTEAPVVAVSLGAKIIEKHFILDKSNEGPDSSFSLNLEEFSEMVRAVRKAELMLGRVDYDVDEMKLKRRQFSRSIFISTDVKQGDIVSSENIRSVRPGNGLHPIYYDEILGKKFNANYPMGTPLSFDCITNE